MLPLLQKFKLGVPIRDMRLLDPHLASNETGRILVRSRCTLSLTLVSGHAKPG